MKYKSNIDSSSTEHPIEVSMNRLAEFFGGNFKRKQAETYAKELINFKFDPDIVDSCVNGYVYGSESFPSFANVLNVIRQKRVKKSDESGKVFTCPHKICDGSMSLVVDYGDGHERYSRCRCDPKETDYQYFSKMKKCKIAEGWVDYFYFKNHKEEEVVHAF